LRQLLASLDTEILRAAIPFKPKCFGLNFIFRQRYKQAARSFVIDRECVNVTGTPCVVLPASPVRWILFSNLYIVTPLRQYDFEKIMKTCVLFVALLLATPAFAQSQIDFLQAGRDYTNLFYDGKANEIWMNLSPEMKKVFSEPGGILGMQLQMKGEEGAETGVISEHVLLQGDVVLYQRIVTYQKITPPMIVQWTFDHSGLVTGFFIRSAVPGESQFLDYKDKVALRLPFNGNWSVLSGGRSVAENHHASSVDQRFAADLTTIRHGRIFSGDGARLEQYYCFGRPILAPAAGTVVQVMDGIPDNPIHAPFDSPPAGNFVILDYGNSEYSLMAHFRLGSITVKAGDKVHPGEKIGKCGNSGNAAVPHLHIHLQNTPVLFEGQGLPMQFQNYIANKKFVSVGEPVTGQIIRNKRRK